MTVPVQARLDRTEGGRGIGYGRRREERESFFEFGLFGPLRVRARVKRRRRGREGKGGKGRLSQGLLPCLPLPANSALTTNYCIN